MDKEKFLKAILGWILSKSDFVMIGSYIDYENRCIMVLDENKDVKDWIPLEDEDFKMFEEIKENAKKWYNQEFKGKQ